MVRVTETGIETTDGVRDARRDRVGDRLRLRHRRHAPHGHRRPRRPRARPTTGPTAPPPSSASRPPASPTSSSPAAPTPRPATTPATTATRSTSSPTCSCTPATGRLRRHRGHRRGRGPLDRDDRHGRRRAPRSARSASTSAATSPASRSATSSTPAAAPSSSGDRRGGQATPTTHGVPNFSSSRAERRARREAAAWTGSVPVRASGGQTVAIGVSGEPTMPGRRSGGAVRRKRLRSCSRSQVASSWRYQSSPRGTPSLKRQRWWIGRNEWRLGSRSLPSRPSTA